MEQELKASTDIVKEKENSLNIMQQEEREPSQKTEMDTSEIRRLTSELMEERTTKAEPSARCNEEDEENSKYRDAFQEIQAYA